MFQLIGLWVIAFFLLVCGAIVTSVTYVTNSDLEKIMDHGKTATAKIEEVHWETVNHHQDNYKLWVVFTPENGSPSRPELFVDAETGENAHTGKIDTIQVKYLPEDPRVAYPANTDGPSSKGIYIGVLMVVAGIGLMIFLKRLKNQPESKVEDIETKVWW